MYIDVYIDIRINNKRKKYNFVFLENFTLLMS